MITPNQVQDAFQNQLGRPATDYEIKTYSTASPQTLATLKDVYGKLNTSQSIVDYMKSVGTDPSTAPELAQKYGISGLGTAAGNTSLLKALKGGSPVVQGSLGQSQPPATSIESALGKTPAEMAAANQTGTGIGSADPAIARDNPTVPGSISSAATPPVTDPNNPLSDPTISAQRDTYTAAQKAVSDVTKQIADLNNTINGALQEKRDQIAASGGVVNEAQLRSEVLTENAPLTAELNQLKADRSQAASEQSTAGKEYQQSIADFYKSLSVKQKQTQIDNQASQFDQTLPTKDKYFKFTDPNTGAVTYQDADGNVVSQNQATGSGSTTVSSPSDSSGNTAASVNNVSGLKSGGTFTPFDSTKASFEATTTDIMGKQNGTSQTGLNAKSTLTDFVNTWITGDKNGTPTGYSASDVAKALGVTPTTPIGQLDSTKLAGAVARFETGYDYKTDSFSNNAVSAAAWSSSDASLPPLGEAGNSEAYWTDPATGIKVDTGKSINYIFQSATTLALDKSATVQKFLGGLSGGAGPGRALKNAISNKMAALVSAAGVLQPVLQQEFAANSKALSTQVTYLANIQRALNGAEQGGILTQKLFANNPDVNKYTSTLANATLNDLTMKFSGSADIRAYKAAMVEIGNEYAQVFARGGQRSVQGTDLAQSVADGNVKLADIQKTLDTLQAIGGTVTSTTIDEVRNISAGGGTGAVADFLNYVYGGTTGGSSSVGSSFSARTDTTPAGASSFVESTFSTLYPGQTEQTLQDQYGSQLPKGYQLAFSNSDGSIQGVDPKKDDMSLYTPI